ncbi:multidrug resistance efflux transporter / EamA-like transporter family multi-domain protein [Prevotella sp. oral taxon 306 str. F0472]|uniref:DMT family transporter n=1 Tax=Prevotella sp. oral taxon 306 TaxID=712461 RepID=UPI00025BB754|nr:DMT family transporter [Prevotella sp. oral taxon 306]EID33382.1 multidrug resistance efflux transporter / EamA-like transporter family multi-domain protein [Prevotella sp. oral taxon 306 str. F0472]
MTNTTSIFQRPVWVTIFALTAAIAWGWAYPLIKLGMQEFAISPKMTGSKMLFAGIRFCLSGLIILAIAGGKKRNFAVRKPADWWYLLVFCLLNTTLHYAFFYFGLSHSEGSRAAILNSLSVFSVVIFACLFFKSDHMTLKKIIGCVLGFAGILSLNLGGADSGRFTLLGDGMIILNALCGASASLMIRGLGKRVDVFVGTGYSLAIGGTLLIIPGLFMGATLPNVSTLGGLYLLLLIAISTLGFTLYNKLLTCNPVGKVAIYNSLIPVVGAVTSCLCLNETFYLKYIMAGFLAAAGIYIINKS